MTTRNIYRQKKVIKLSKAKFQVSTNGVKNSTLILDFNEVINYFNLKGSFSLVHFQAKPKKYRQWGIYKSFSDTYKSISDFEVKGVVKTLQVPDNLTTSLPSAVLYVPDYYH